MSVSPIRICSTMRVCSLMSVSFRAAAVVTSRLRMSITKAAAKTAAPTAITLESCVPKSPDRSVELQADTPTRPRGRSPGTTAVRGTAAPGRGRCPVRIEPLPLTPGSGWKACRIAARCRAAAAKRPSATRCCVIGAISWAPRSGRPIAVMRPPPSVQQRASSRCDCADFPQSPLQTP